MLLSGVHSGVIRIMQSDIDVSYFPTIHGFEHQYNLHFKWDQMIKILCDTNILVKSNEARMNAVVALTQKNQTRKSIQETIISLTNIFYFLKLRKVVFPGVSVL